MDEAEHVEKPPPARRIANRYDVLEPLGQGGMAVVYRVRDASSGRELACKQLLANDSAEHDAKIVALFEREYHLLAQLAHPSVIEVYDYGIDDDGRAYYTMELLDGGDLRDRVPVPWREACGLCFDVCSSLALLHSRRLVHRDVTPRNVRCTRDGRAKLIDFGAMAAMADGGDSVVGTPAFCAPETLQRSAVDGRADLFSLGVTLYHALTGRMAYPARSFADALQAWTHKPSAPSASVAGVPQALDELVLSLLAIEPELRPRSAFEVMQRLSAIAELACVEDEGVSRAYLTTPLLVGREHELALLRDKLERALRGRGSAVLLRAEHGLGRSRMLDALALESKTRGARVLRTRVAGGDQPFATALALAEHALDAIPNAQLALRFPSLFEAVAPSDGAEVRMRLRAPDELTADPERLQTALCEFLFALSRVHALLVAVDDVERIDGPSAAVFASLADKAPRRRILLALTAPESSEPTPRALEVLARRLQPIALAPLAAREVELLFGSIFGDVPHLHMLAREVHAIARGNPQRAIDVAQHLLDEKRIVYEAGTWTLPDKLDARDLPASAEAALSLRVDALGPAARFLAQAHALAFDEHLSRDDYRALAPELEPGALEAALSELFFCHALMSDRSVYRLANRLWVRALRSSIDRGREPELHRALADMYRERNLMARCHHLFAAGLDEQGLDGMNVLQAQFAENFDHNSTIALNATAMGPSFTRAIACAAKLQRPARELHELRRWMTALSVISKAEYYFDAAPAWLEQLKHDSGLAAWQADHANENAVDRLTRALQGAQERYLAAPEAERVYRVEEAIRFLAQYVAISIAIAQRILDLRLLSSLPGLLEPFVALSPMIEAIWQNVRASNDSARDCCWERARERWLPVHEKLGSLSGAELQHATTIRNAIAYGIGMTEVSIGLPTCADWAERLDSDSSQRVSAMMLRKIARLQQGDWKGAERAQRQAEILTLQARTPSMFYSLLTIELWVYTQARDLAGLKDVTARIEQCALQFPGWQPQLMLARARFEFVRGDLEQARLGFEQCIAATDSAARDGSGTLAAWAGAQSSLAEVLLALDRVDEAHARAQDAIAIATGRGADAVSHDLVRALALCEARLGRFDSARARLSLLLEKETARGVIGLKLGLCYEACARVALASTDHAGFERYASLAAREYRLTGRSPLFARHQRLVLEAGRQGWVGDAQAADVAASVFASHTPTGVRDPCSKVEIAMLGASDERERALRALRLVCDEHSAQVAHFFRVANDVLTHVASHGTAEPPHELAPRARDYLVRDQELADTETSIATSALDATVAENVTRVRAGSGSYELMPLCASSGGPSSTVGVIAIEVSSGPSRRRARVKAQLLKALAGHFAR